MTDIPTIPAAAFAKQDPTPDALFYAAPRFVTHIDDTAIAGLTELYRTILPAGGHVLDLMSSWVSHLPPERTYAAVIGHGMNADELARNPRLSRVFVQDLNADPILPLADGSLDAVTCCVSVQYLQQPVAVLSEVRRVLKPGGCVVISFSNRCFPTKAIALWGRIGGPERVRLVALYLQHAGFGRIEAADPVPEGAGSDPLHAVIGWKAEA